MATHDEMLLVSEAARRLGVSPATLRRWADAGVVEAVRLPARGDRRIALSEVERLRREVLSRPDGEPYSDFWLHWNTTDTIDGRFGLAWINVLHNPDDAHRVFAIYLIYSKWRAQGQRADAQRLARETALALARERIDAGIPEVPTLYRYAVGREGALVLQSEEPLTDLTHG